MLIFVIIVNLIAEQVSDYTSPQLAVTTFIPDAKGIGGEDNGTIWENTRAVPRSYTIEELAYLKLWAELRSKYADENDLLNEDAEKNSMRKFHKN